MIVSISCCHSGLFDNYDLVVVSILKNVLRSALYVSDCERLISFALCSVVAVFLVGNKGCELRCKAGVVEYVSEGDICVECSECSIGCIGTANKREVVVKCKVVITEILDADVSNVGSEPSLAHRLHLFLKNF